MKKVSGWFYDIVSQFDIAYRKDVELGMRNSGDYYHHDWIGPYKTFAAAKKAGAKELRLRVHMAERELLGFLNLTEKK